MSATVLSLMWAACVVWLVAILWHVARSAHRPTRAAAQTDAQAEWRRELDAFIARHPVDGDDSDMVA